MKFKFWKKDISKGDTYAVQTGDYAGEILTFIEKDEEFYYFLSTPLMSNRKIPKEKFDFAKEHSIIEFVERLPKNILRVVEKQFEENKK